jgi:hypothetical protein
MDGRLREFNFRRKHIGEEAVYDIDVGEGWTIREKQTPAWILQALPGFHDAIEEKEIVSNQLIQDK